MYTNIVYFMLYVLELHWEAILGFRYIIKPQNYYYASWGTQRAYKQACMDHRPALENTQCFKDLVLNHEIVQKRSGSNTILDQLLAEIQADA